MNGIHYWYTQLTDRQFNWLEVLFFFLFFFCEFQWLVLIEDMDSVYIFKDPTFLQIESINYLVNDSGKFKNFIKVNNC